MSASDDHLTYCPFCDYRLDGHAGHAHCPECGQAVDRRWRVFGGRRLPRLQVNAVRGLVVGLLLLNGLGLPLVLSTTTPNRVPWFVYGFVVALVGIVLLLLPGRGRGFLAIGPDGLAYCPSWRRRELRLIPWVRLGTARHNWLRKRIEIECDGQPLIVPAGRVFSVDVAEVDRFVREFNGTRIQTLTSSHGH